MAVPTALTGLTMAVAYDLRHDAEDPVCHVIWSSVSKLPLLISLDVNQTYLGVEDFQTVALMTQLTKLHLCSDSINLQCSAEDINRLSAFSSLQCLHLDFMHFGVWSDAVQKLDSALKHLLNRCHMQYFQVVNCECPLEVDESDSDQQAPLEGVPEGSRSGASDVNSDGHAYDSLSDN